MLAKFEHLQPDVFMWSIVLAFSAVSYVPAIVQERPIYLRYTRLFS